MDQQDSTPGGGTPGPRQTQGSRRTAMRLMQRRSQGLVAVYEQDPENPDDHARVLVFESRAKRVQVEQFPSEWQRLSDEELIAIQRESA